MTAADIVILLAVGVCLYFAIRSAVKSKGKCPGCSGNCSCCDKNKSK